MQGFSQPSASSKIKTLHKRYSYRYSQGFFYCNGQKEFLVMKEEKVK